MKKEKGITLISLVVTIIILAILASIATYSGASVIKSAKLTAFTTELEIMQTQVNALYQEDDKTKVYGQEITGDIKEQANIVFTTKESGISTVEGYRYWSNEEIKSLGIEGVKQDFFVNLAKRSVVSFKGLEYEGEKYYTLHQLPNGLYNVEYKEPNEGKPNFTTQVQKMGENKWRIAILEVQYENGYINKWQVQYKLKEKENWNMIEDLSFVVNEKGIYQIKIVNDKVESEVQEIPIDEI